MRAREIMEDVSGAALPMLMKLRKGGAASLNAARFAEILPYLPGWTMEKAKFKKPSSGGWLKRETPGGVNAMFNRSTGRIEITEYVYDEHEELTDLQKKWKEANQAREEQKRQEINRLMTVTYPKLVELSKKPFAKDADYPTSNRWAIVDPRIDQTKTEGVNKLVISYEFMVECNGVTITSPDGQTFEVFGDFKNGADESRNTFEAFFHKAAESTNIMDLILEALQMEAHEKKQDPKAKYTPPPTATAEERKVFTFLQQMTAGVRAEQKEHRIDASNRLVQRILEAAKTGDKKEIERVYQADPFLFQYVWDKKANALRDDWKSEVDRLAEKDVEEMQNMFVFKNTRKLAPILSAKKQPFTENVVGLNTNGGIITATILFNFDDGSSFRVDQSIVASYATDSWHRVTHFYRFPTTFHDVVMPDGSKMGMPSEERMNEIFAKA